MPRRSLGEESSRSGTCKGPGVGVWLQSSGSERQLWSVHLRPHRLRWGLGLLLSIGVGMRWRVLTKEACDLAYILK